MSRGEADMHSETQELWQKLCEQAAVEQDPKRLDELTAEINRLLQEDRLNKTLGLIKNQRVLLLSPVPNAPYPVPLSSCW